ncbi:hypothetical protein [Flavobacterium wongokense]|uniref:hypothetical protein n=1 Tax=Flavobacterium wongokense TaxID=2910674 RepID=UPI001F21AC87|nr:hypothetical protein [Flavobacterium sp. WG47]MCF6131550.1 hypothetical protein [Flavobacterium sp. WG47]
MKRIASLLVLLAIISCKKENQLNNSVIAKTDTVAIEKKSIAPDTIFFTYDDKTKWNDFAVVYLLDKKYSEDSICTATFKIDFKGYNRQANFSKTLKIKGVDEGAEWSGELELDSVASPLKRIDFGYPACGYTHNHYLFYIDGNNSNLIHEWFSSWDSGWGYWSGVVSGEPQDFYFRTESLSPVEESSTAEGDYEYASNEFTDSIHFKLENNKWKKIFLTQKDKVYRSRKVKFEEFYKQD